MKETAKLAPEMKKHSKEKRKKKREKRLDRGGESWYSKEAVEQKEKETEEKKRKKPLTKTEPTAIIINVHSSKGE